MSIWFEGYGCTANQGETLEMRDHANQLGHELASSSDSAKTVVLGTCTVIESTQNKMEKRISELMDQGKYDEAEELFESVMPKLRAFRADVKKKTGHDAGEKAVMNIMGNHMGQRRPPVNPINSEEKAQLRSLIESFGWPLP